MKQEDKMYDTQLDVSVAAKQEKETFRETEGLEGLMKNGSKRTERGLKVDISIPEECSPLYSNADLDYKKNEDEPTVASRDFKTVEKGLKSSPKLAGMPNIRDLDLGNGKIFALIESGDYTGVERFLAERGHKVIITPKIGCSPIHYSKLNLANCENGKGDTPLIMAAKIDCTMVDIILSYGGNPNYTNVDRDSPLTIAANRYDKETISALLLAGGNLEAAVVKLTSSLRYVSEKELRDNSESGFSVRPLTILLADNVYLKCRDPIKTAFCVDKSIKKIKNVRDEFTVEFEMLMKEADVFAYKFLDNCDKMAEAKEILSHPVNLLRIAIDQEKKQFVSHPFSQQLINERWNGDLTNTLIHGKTLIYLKYITSPVVLPLLFLKFLLFEIHKGIPIMKSSFAALLRLTFTPCLCFLTDTLNYLAFLAIMVCVCVIQTDYKIGPMETVLYSCVLSRIFIELDFLVQQGARRYFRDFWNIVDIVVILLLSVASIYEVMIHLRLERTDRKFNLKMETEQAFDYKKLEENVMMAHQDSMRVNYIHSVTEFILTIRILGLLEISKSLGTMLIALKYLIIDVLKFGILLLTIVFGTAIAIYSMTITINEWNVELERSAKLFSADYTFTLLPYNRSHPAGIVKPPDVFKTFPDTIRNLLWSTFGLLNVEVNDLVCLLYYF